jgi:hypothetical protein
MWDRYRDWMYAWETRLNARDTNRVVRPLDWGLDWTERWPGVNGTRERALANPEAYLAQLNEQIVSRSDDFYAYRTPRDFLLFTSPVRTPYSVNNLPGLAGFLLVIAGRCWCCRSGMPTPKATTRSAGSSTSWASRRCA